MKLIAAVDLSRASSYIVEAVHRVALATDAEVTVLHVVTPLPGMADPEFTPAAEVQELTSRFLDEQDQLADLVQQLIDVGVDASALLRVGQPAKTILREAERQDAELIVVGSHGRGLLFDALVGSVSAEILRHAAVPVLVVPVRGM
jgi:nucleotide-binding universal stress UspA family protein